MLEAGPACSPASVAYALARFGELPSSRPPHTFAAMRSATSIVALFALHLAACGDIVLPSTGGTDLGGTSGQPDSGGSDGGSDSGVDDLGGGTDGADEDVDAPGPGSDTEAPAADVDAPADAQDPADVPADDDTGPTVSGPGAPCSADAQCASGYCVDGVCCYTACDTPCVACTTALSGLPEGSCGPVQANTDPKGTCPDDGAPSCGRTGVCDGKGACSLYPATTECSAPTCADGERTLAGACDGQGACASGDTTSCAPYACAGNACAGECASDASCVGSTWCNGSTV